MILETVSKLPIQQQNVLFCGGKEEYWQYFKDILQ